MNAAGGRAKSKTSVIRKANVEGETGLHWCKFDSAVTDNSDTGTAHTILEESIEWFMVLEWREHAIKRRTSCHVSSSGSWVLQLVSSDHQSKHHCTEEQGGIGRHRMIFDVVTARKRRGNRPTDPEDACIVQSLRWEKLWLAVSFDKTLVSLKARWKDNMPASQRSTRLYDSDMVFFPLITDWERLYELDSRLKPRVMLFRVSDRRTNISIPGVPNRRALPSCGPHISGPPLEAIHSVLRFRVYPDLGNVPKHLMLRL
ncbi:hypothetical protein NEOLEDRAFT_1173385 [Neolentinus lepideus HHB14362 ss-1]|uniref:Uncharacterized protein n=1 Tax=Neolentinus lepideus HHB14362 ss-1 TaxID=1314782 RepID=A0A165MVM6_9AGAM|nr:hypothetical protein NEOLEDRAFT_1173385 [Neolentinus lepideus HHB14362 ss-1]